MKNVFLPLAIGTVLITAGCGDKPSATAPSAQPKPPVSTMPQVGSKPGETPPPVPPPTASDKASAPGGESTAKADPGFKIDIGSIDLNTISMALQQYVAANQLDPNKLTEQDLQNLVKGKYLPQLPPPPAGKKYVWNNMLQVSLANK